ncbi:hypothetical protein PIB30_046527 [Stylosanthes scabra]|uniref:Uncharacterized protein n=1 Tax=Stylosanthes scabra TaxID=79078 RepID=A0ABU6RGI0_9FABA|nr:hypothetical protein [Stylosanthes scabra]
MKIDLERRRREKTRWSEKSKEMRNTEARPQQQTTRRVSTCGAVDRRRNVGIEESGGGEPLMLENPSGDGGERTREKEKKLWSIYEKYRKSSRQGGSSGESHGLCGGVMDEYSNCGEEARGDVLKVETHT